MYSQLLCCHYISLVGVSIAFWSVYVAQFSSFFIHTEIYLMYLSVPCPHVWEDLTLRRIASFLRIHEALRIYNGVFDL